MGIGNLGVSELMIVAVLVLLLFGPRRLPEIGRTVGQALREFKRGMNEVKRELDQMDRRPSGEGEDEGAERDAPRGRLRPPDRAPGPGEPPGSPTGGTDDAAEPEGEAGEAGGSGSSGADGAEGSPEKG